MFAAMDLKWSSKYHPGLAENIVPSHRSGVEWNWVEEGGTNTC